jgi:chemotaxis signal transduction protein
VIEERVQVVLFQVGPRVFAAGVHDVVRIGNVREVPAADLVVETAVGMPFDRERGVVVFGDDGVDRTVVVDQVLGVRTVPQSDVIPLPAFAAACLTSGAVIGFVVVDDAPVLLLDLPTLVRERPGAAPAHRAA